MGYLLLFFCLWLLKLILIHFVCRFSLSSFIVLPFPYSFRPSSISRLVYSQLLMNLSFFPLIFSFHFSLSLLYFSFLISFLHTILKSYIPKTPIINQNLLDH